MIKKLSLALIIAIIFTAIPVFSVDVNAVTEETITAPSAVLMETSSGKILFEKIRTNSDPAHPLQRL